MGIKTFREELCNGCGLCVEDCPMDVFVMDEATGKAKLAYPEDCWECNRFFCETGCPTQAIEVTPAAVHKLYKPY